MSTVTALRELAEKAERAWRAYGGGGDWECRMEDAWAFNDEVTPEVVLELLDERDVLQEALEAIDTHGHRFKPWWAGGDGQEHAETCQGCVARSALARRSAAEEPQ